jgi:hypothetical protein
VQDILLQRPVAPPIEMTSVWFLAFLSCRNSATSWKDRTPTYNVTKQQATRFEAQPAKGVKLSPHQHPHLFPFPRPHTRFIWGILPCKHSWVNSGSGWNPI